MSRDTEFQAQFARLRAAYDAAFGKLCRAMADLQALPKDAPQSDLQTAKKKVDACRRECNHARNQLGIFLLARKVERASFRLNSARNRAA